VSTTVWPHELQACRKTMLASPSSPKPGRTAITKGVMIAFPHEQVPRNVHKLSAMLALSRSLVTPRRSERPVCQLKVRSPAPESRAFLTSD
jgi:uncharacterized protein with von Willebrand factor type A (vWA) domain